jgi:hypothetical protein
VRGVALKMSTIRPELDSGPEDRLVAIAAQVPGEPDEEEEEEDEEEEDDDEGANEDGRNSDGYSE